MLELVRSNLRLVMEFIITVLILIGSFVVVLLPDPVGTVLNQRAYELTTLVLGYWFGRGISRPQEPHHRERRDV